MPGALEGARQPQAWQSPSSSPHCLRVSLWASLARASEISQVTQGWKTKSSRRQKLQLNDGHSPHDILALCPSSLSHSRLAWAEEKREKGPLSNATTQTSSLSSNLPQTHKNPGRMEKCEDPELCWGIGASPSNLTRVAESFFKNLVIYLFLK